MSYRFLEDVSIADVAFEAQGRTLEDLFKASALAVTNTMVRDLKSVEPKKSLDVYLTSEDIETLLFNFLQEIVFHKDANRLLLVEYAISISKGDPSWTLKGILRGEELDPSKHELLVDVKAVTMHLFEVKEVRDLWKARVVLDV